METLKERLIQAIDRLGITKAQFEKNVGLSNGFVDKSGDNTRKSSLEKISNIYPQINVNWLMTGDGNMFKDAYKPSVHAPGKSDHMHIVPLLPVSAQGGSFNDFVESVKESDCEKIVSPVKSADLAITVSGDSMTPRYPSGCKILIKRINEKAFIEWGHVYVLDTCNGVVIKKIEPGADENELICESLNPIYKPFRVSMDDVYGVYKVIMMMNLE